MEQDPKDIFTRLNSSEEKLKLFMELSTHKGELLCKASASDQIIRLIAQRVDFKRELVCQLSPGTQIPVPLPAEVVVSFFLGAEKYFLTSKLANLGGGFYEINLDPDLFHLQRRQSYRIRIPESYQSELKVTHLNDVRSKLSGSLYDLSSGGCRMMINHDQPVLKIDDHVEGEIRLARRAPLAYQGKVRHVKVEKKASPPYQIVGIEFVDMNTQMEGRLFSITMELHRELFARWLER